jgi:type IV pilus assembly protein PilP
MKAPVRISMRNHLAPSLVALALCLTACEDDPPPAPPAPAAPRPTAPAANAPAQNAGTARDGGPPPLSLPTGESAFIENNGVRDPFRDYIVDLLPPTAVEDVVEERQVILREYGIDDLRLVAVVLGTDSPYAMVTDPSGRGTILRRGMLVGRREVVRNSDGQDYFVHWRVARVLQARLRRTQDGQLDEHPAELVFERTDPSNRSSQLTERSLALGAMRNESVATSTTALPSSVVIPGVGNNAPSYLPNSLGGAGQAPTAPSGNDGSRPPPPPTTTTVVVQAPPAPAAQLREIPPTQTPPAVRVTGGESPLNNR